MYYHQEFKMPRQPNPKKTALNELLSQQRVWSRDIEREEPDYPDYVKRTTDNLLLGKFRPQTEDDFTQGSGGEFKRRRHKKTGVIFPPKFHALKSSSVLACNVFDFWRNGGESVIGEALGCKPHQMVRMKFEAQFQNGVSLNPCNLDVALYDDEGWICAVESKFTEPLGRKSPLKPEYLPATPQPTPWKMEGLVNCDRLARDHKSYTYLDVAQLLKHTLGLFRTLKADERDCATKDRFRLMYLFYDINGPTGEAHKREAEKFKQAVEGEIDFAWMTYQELIPRLKDSSNGSHQEYFGYLEQRYRLE